LYQNYIDNINSFPFMIICFEIDMHVTRDQQQQIIFEGQVFP
jgi:hypothetical protein